MRSAVLASGAVLFLIPFYLLLRNGLSTEAEITSPDWKLHPSAIQWGNVAELFSDPSVSMARSLLNSNLHQLFVAAAISILPLVVMFVFLQRWIVEGVERSGINE